MPAVNMCNSTQCVVYIMICKTTVCELFYEDFDREKKSEAKSEASKQGEAFAFGKLPADGKIEVWTFVIM